MAKGYLQNDETRLYHVPIPLSLTATFVSSSPTAPLPSSCCIISFSNVNAFHGVLPPPLIGIYGVACFAVLKLCISVAMETGHSSKASARQPDASC